MRVTVEFSWRTRGPVRLEAGRLRFPDAPEAPGIYRFDLRDRVYIGETDRLRRRFQHYRTPGPTQLTNLRLNALLLQLLEEPRTIDVSTVTEANVEIDGTAAPLDLRHKAARRLVENAALTAAIAAGERVENL